MLVDVEWQTDWWFGNVCHNTSPLRLHVISLHRIECITDIIQSLKPAKRWKHGWRAERGTAKSGQKTANSLWFRKSQWDSSHARVYVSEQSCNESVNGCLIIYIEMTWYEWMIEQLNMTGWHDGNSNPLWWRCHYLKIHTDTRREAHMIPINLCSYKYLESEHPSAYSAEQLKWSLLGDAGNG